MIHASGSEPDHIATPTMTYTTREHCLSDDPQVFSFVERTDIPCDRIKVVRWVVTLINGHQHRKMTASWTYDRQAARELWQQLQSCGAKPFQWA
jgi:hypothetical protein